MKTNASTTTTKSRKPTLSDLYIRHGFDIQGLAAQANVAIEAIDRMLLDQTVSSTIAIRVLNALSLRTGRAYSLNNVAVNLSERRQ